MIPKFPTRLAALFIACAGSFAAHAQTTTPPPERKVVVFGDGYSDAGNLDHLTNPGGCVWIELFLGAVTDPNFEPGVTGNVVAVCHIRDGLYV